MRHTENGNFEVDTLRPEILRSPCGTERRAERNAARAAQASKIKIGIAKTNRGAIFFGVVPVTRAVASAGGPGP